MKLNLTLIRHLSDNGCSIILICMSSILISLWSPVTLSYLPLVIQHLISHKFSYIFLVAQVETTLLDLESCAHGALRSVILGYDQLDCSCWPEEKDKIQES